MAESLRGRCALTRPELLQDDRHLRREADRSRRSQSLDESLRRTGVKPRRPRRQLVAWCARDDGSRAVYLSLVFDLRDGTDQRSRAATISQHDCRDWKSLANT